VRRRFTVERMIEAQLKCYGELLPQLHGRASGVRSPN
jgi:hypothetical protein